MITKNIEKNGAPEFTAEEERYARAIQAPLTEQFGTEFPIAIDTRIHPVPENPEPSKGSTDVGDISWRIPTGGLRAACFAAGSPGHSWQNVASIGSSIGEKGILLAARALAITALDLMEDPQLVEGARAEWKRRMQGLKYFSFIPKGQKAPAAIR